MIKVTYSSEPAPAPLSYPRLMMSKTTGAVYLMEDKNNGTRIKKGEKFQSYRLGCHLTIDDETVLQDCTGTVTLENQS